MTTAVCSRVNLRLYSLYSDDFLLPGNELLIERLWSLYGSALGQATPVCTATDPLHTLRSGWHAWDELGPFLVVFSAVVRSDLLQACLTNVPCVDESWPQVSSGSR